MDVSDHLLARRSRTCSTPASQHVWKTTNGGQTWDRISPDLTRHDPKTMGPSGGPITRDMNGPEVYAVIFAIGPSSATSNVIWTGSDDGIDARDARRRQDVGERHAEGHAGSRPRQHHRRVGVRARRRVRRGEASAARRHGAVHLPHARFRQDVDEDRDRHSRRRLRPRGARRSRRARACSTRRRSTASTSRTTTATTGSRCARTCPTFRVATLVVAERDLAISTSRPRVLHPRQHRAAAAVQRRGSCRSSDPILYKPAPAVRSHCRRCFSIG